MERRRFLGLLCGVSFAPIAVSLVSACSDEQASLASQGKAASAAGKFQTFGYYEGLGTTETRDPSRTDGTTYNMPCLTADEIAAGLEKIYDFWHGHDGQQHHFTVTAEHFAQLKSGHEVEIFTSIVEDHRHALLLSPTRRCESKAC